MSAIGSRIDGRGGGRPVRDKNGQWTCELNQSDRRRRRGWEGERKKRERETQIPIINLSVDSSASNLNKCHSHYKNVTIVFTPNNEKTQSIIVFVCSWESKSSKNWNFYPPYLFWWILLNQQNCWGFFPISSSNSSARQHDLLDISLSISNIFVCSAKNNRI